MGMLTMLERELVVVVSSFEAVLCHANINLCRGTQRICSFKYLFLGRLPAGWQIIFV